MILIVKVALVLVFVSLPQRKHPKYSKLKDSGTKIRMHNHPVLA